MTLARPPSRELETIVGVTLVVGLEVHVELATPMKLFTRMANPASADGASDEAGPNTLIDPVVLALPGALPVLCRGAIEASMRVGLALGCRVAATSVWDRKGYFYPDLPKAYQISQFQLPICFDGAFELPGVDEKGFPDLEQPPTRIGIARAHLEEDAGKLLHEAPGGGEIQGSIVDWNRAGTPLLEIVTQPDFRSSQQVVLFAKLLRQLCRFLGATRGVMQAGHMRFEPNINCVLTLRDGSVITTPIVEVKNLNSFKALEAAIEHERREQPARWVEDGLVHGPAMKTTRGWDDAREVTFVMREKEDALDYRYFPDPDLPAITIESAWVEQVRGSLPELPLARLAKLVRDAELPVKEGFALVEERATCEFFEAAVRELLLHGIPAPRATKLAANLVLGAGFRRANERGVRVEALGIGPSQLAELALLRERGKLANTAVDEVFDALCEPAERGVSAEALAGRRGLLVVRDDAAMARWIAGAIAAHPQAAADVREGKQQAIGRLIGEVTKLAKLDGQAVDAKVVREALLQALS
jgi:aspartyl-tRNA(Asn)/glutamyl-tRNA(Gln) amidotransferase subunit B